MASLGASGGAAPVEPTEAVSILRLNILRAAYLLLVVGLGAVTWPEILSHEVGSRGVIPSLLAALSALALLGLLFPLKMLPLLMFELGWKVIWMIAYALPQWQAERFPPTFTEDAFAIGLGVILMPLAIPWAYVWRHYVKEPAERYR
jgi:Ni/Fe-hydrogenase subunit HybB-like protein